MLNYWWTKFRFDPIIAQIIYAAENQDKCVLVVCWNKHGGSSYFQVSPTFLLSIFQDSCQKMEDKTKWAFLT